MEKEQIILTLVALVTAAYGLIFKDVMSRIKYLEELGCDPEGCEHRFGKIEEKQEKIDPTLTEIKVQLARIESTNAFILEELKKR